MRRALIKYDDIEAGILSELDNGEYQFVYDGDYIKNHPEKFITFQMLVSTQVYSSKRLFPFFDGLIPEGWLLSIASEGWKINKNDRMGLLLACCQNAIGAVTVHPLNDDMDGEA